MCLVKFKVFSQTDTLFRPSSSLQHVFGTGVSEYLTIPWRLSVTSSEVMLHKAQLKVCVLKMARPSYFILIQMNYSGLESHPTPTRSIKQIKAQYPVADRVPTFRLYWGRVLPGLVSPRDLEDFRLDQSIMQASFAAGSQKSTASSLVTPVKRRQHSKAPEVSLGSNHRRVLSPSSDGESSEDELLLKSSQHR